MAGEIARGFTAGFSLGLQREKLKTERERLAREEKRLEARAARDIRSERREERRLGISESREADRAAGEKISRGIRQTELGLKVHQEQRAQRGERRAQSEEERKVEAASQKAFDRKAKMDFAVAQAAFTDLAATDPTNLAGIAAKTESMVSAINSNKETFATVFPQLEHFNVKSIEATEGAGNFVVMLEDPDTKDEFALGPEGQDAFFTVSADLFSRLRGQEPAKGVIKETAEGLQVIDPSTQVATPVRGAGGEVVKGKPSAAAGRPVVMTAESRAIRTQVSGLMGLAIDRDTMLLFSTEGETNTPAIEKANAVSAFADLLYKQRGEKFGGLMTPTQAVQAAYAKFQDDPVGFMEDAAAQAALGATETGVKRRVDPLTGDIIEWNGKEWVESKAAARSPGAFAAPGLALETQ